MKPRGSLAERAGAWRRQYRRQAALDGAARLGAAGVLALSAALWADQALMLSQRSRLGLLAGAAVALGWGAWRWLLRPLLGGDWGGLLDAAAQRFPEARDYLRSAWELSGEGSSPGTSEPLRRAHLEAADRLVGALPLKPVFQWRPSPGLKAAALASALAAASLPWLAPGAAWERILRPWRDVALEQLLKISPGDAAVDWGRSVTIAAQWLPQAPSGRARHRLTLWLKGPDGWRRAAWDSAADGAHRFTAEQLSAPLRYRLEWRDHASRVYTLTPVSVPQLESLRAKSHGAQPLIVPLNPDEELAVMRGTFLTVAGRPNQPLAKAALRLSSQPQAIPMKLSASGDYEAGFVAQEDATMRFELESEDGRVDRAPASYSLRALPDQPPVVELLSPLQPLQASPADVVALAYSAKDDGGLSRLSLLIRPAGRPEKEIPLQRFSSRREFLGDYSWELAGLPLGRVEFQIKALDNAASPQAALSAKGVVELVDFEAGHARMEKLWLKAEQDLKAAGERAEKLSQQLAQGRPSEEELQAQSKEWAQAAAGMRQLAEAMGQDAYANPGLAEESQAAAEGLSRAERRDVPAAQKAAREGASDAAARQERLARQAKQAQRLLGEGRKLQGLQDFYTQAGRMAQSGASLEARLESLAGGGKPSGEAKAQLDEALGKLQKQLESLQKTLEALPKASPSSADPSRRAMELPVHSARENADALARAMARGDYAEAARLARKLSEDLAKIEQAVGQAAGESAASALPPDSAQAVQRAQALWSEVVEEQARLVERTRKLEEGLIQRRLDAQRELLAQLARRQAVIVSSSALQPGFPPDALASMRAAQAEFESRKVENAPALLSWAAGRLRGQAAQRGPGGSGLSETAAQEEAIAAELEKAAGPGASGPAGPEAEEAGRQQAALKSKTGKLQGELESLQADVGELPDGLVDKVAAAQAEQAGAADALGRRDSAAALPRQEKALELLGDGGGQMSQSAAGKQRSRAGMMQPFQRPGGTIRLLRGGSGGSGAQIGSVPLPATKDYAPPRELREELQRSLHESHPEAYDSLIKEYFKRIAQ